MIDKDNPNWGCIVLCPDKKLSALRGTVKCLQAHMKGMKPICVVPKSTSAFELDDLEKICPVHIGGHTYTSLINKGLQKTKLDWNLIMMAGCSIKPKFYYQYLKRLENEKDIIYPIIDKKWLFSESNLNGLLVHKSILKIVGKFPEIADLHESKLVWAYNAISKGYQLKGILGVRIY